MPSSESASNKIIGSRDPVLKFLRGRKLTPWKIFTLALLIFNVPLVVYAFSIDGLQSRQGFIGLLDDYNVWVTSFLGNPFTWFFYLLFPYLIEEVVRTIRENKIVYRLKTKAPRKGRAKNDYEYYVQRLVAVESDWRWYVGVFLAVLLFQSVLLVPQHINFKNVIASSGIMVAIYEIWFFPLYWAACITAIRVLIFVWWISKLFSDFKVRLFFLHADECCGFGSIGAYVSKMGWLIGLWGLVLGTIILTENRQLTGQFGGMFFVPIIMLPLIFYLLGAPLAFFGPLWTTHVAMKEARAKEMNAVAQMFNEGLFGLNTPSLRGADARMHLENIELSGKLSELIASARVWPFTAPDLLRYLARTYIIPLIPVAFEVAVKVI